MKNVFWFVLSTFFIVGIISCKKEINSPNFSKNEFFKINDSFPDDEYFVPKLEIIEIAKKYTENVFKYGIVDNKVNRGVSNSYVIPDRYGKAAFYVINYSNNEGVIIFSADFRFEPIVYFSNSGNINSGDTIPNSFNNILDVYKRKIEDLRYDRDGIDSQNYNLQLLVAYDAWNYLDNIFNHCCLTLMPYPSPWEEYDPCIGYTYPPPYIVNPLISTLWEQDGAYNLLCPEKNCNGNIKRVDVGCVGVAVAQVVRYVEPITNFNYNYSQMYNNLPYSPIQDGHRLLADAYALTNIITACDYTFSITTRAKSVLKNNFNIHSVKRDGTISSNSLSVKDRLRTQVENGKPVILGGTTNFKILAPLNVFNNAHSWILDGYRHEQYCTFTTSYFHMNWGWGDFPGWCLWNNWLPYGEDEAYELALSMVYDIVK
ncbi:MAG TPA: C10 family peptidase [Edaphocola sp.]|nr:C10 family peptidase [Edaphocola sp.]